MNTEYKPQDISTAPKDGTWIFLFGGCTSEDDYKGEVQNDLTRPVSAKWVRNSEDGREYWAIAYWDGEWREEYHNPTHWAPNCFNEKTQKCERRDNWFSEIQDALETTRHALEKYSCSADCKKYNMETDFCYDEVNYGCGRYAREALAKLNEFVGGYKK